MAYVTQPGTIPHRVLGYLRENPETEFSTATLCEELDLDPSTFAATMKWAKVHGAVSARRIPGRGPTMFWKLGDGKPEAPDPHIAAFDRLIDDPRGAKAAAKAALPTPAPAPEPFRAALWTDGSLILVGAAVRPDGAVILPKEQVMRLKSLIAWSPLT